MQVRDFWDGGCWDGRFFFIRDSTPCRLKGSHLCTFFWDIRFWSRTLIFLKAPLAPIHTNFEKWARAEKTRFFGQNFPKKSLKTPFLACFFFNFGCSAENLAKTVFLVLWQSSESQFSRPKKITTKFSNFFENPHPPFEKILDPPLYVCTTLSSKCKNTVSHLILGCLLVLR